jgi:hypothetical protein
MDPNRWQVARGENRFERASQIPRIENGTGERREDETGVLPTLPSGHPRFELANPAAV